jgi:hypothetical protein
MTASSLKKSGSLLPKGLLTIPLAVTYLALSALSVQVGIEAMSNVFQPIESASSDLPSSADPASLLGGDPSR